MSGVIKTRQGEDSNDLSGNAQLPERPGGVLAGGIRITGRVKEPLFLSIEELCGMETEEAEDIALNCGEGTPVGKIQSCRGVLLENVIGRAAVLKEDHNDTKKMFLVASAPDGYKAVFSWQEIFNTPIGGGVMVLVEKNGKPLSAGTGGLELISLQDFFSGPRYVRSLETIEVLMVG
ncbi:MAG: molybdopterin-dependent oxidoreductase [Syntrophobacteraceae bacterium]|nr:molybdopterin-dependent oxidoreductase [Syntrophobacteraceae bacterium]